MTESKYFKDDSILEYSLGFFHTFYFLSFAGGFYPTAAIFFHPMTSEFENSIEFYLYDLRVYVHQIISIRLSINNYIMTILKILSICFSERRAKK